MNIKIVMVSGFVFLCSLTLFGTNINESLRGLLFKHLPENPIIVEAGAHNGSDTKEMSKLWPQGKIYAFEPIPNLYQMLRNAVQSCQNVRTFAVALADKNGTSSIYVSEGEGIFNASSSLFKPKEHLNHYPYVNFLQQLIVPTITLDEWARQNNVDQVDFLWLDMQGAEYCTLSAAPKILASVKVIFTEVSMAEMYEGCPLYDQFKAWLEQQGFEEIYKDFTVPAMPKILFIRKKN